ncbi:MAG TPA: hypothetical protein VFG36_03015 [Methanoregula sp.]|nr:hypothetical protein [Methanoregula sp.]
MDIITDSVKKIATLLKNSGCEEGSVILDVDPSIKYCQYDKGACMVATFGGRSAEFVTHDPIRARTKISFMFDAALETLRSRAAAGSIINVAAGFFCISRILHSCPESSHTECLKQLEQEMREKRIVCIGDMQVIESAFRNSIAHDPDTADVILINSEGIIKQGTGDIVQKYKDTKRILCIGPSSAGVAGLNQIELWCPFGTFQWTGRKE